MNEYEDDRYREENVVKALRIHLENVGYKIENPNDTKRSHGADIRAIKNNKKLLIEAKGYPPMICIQGSNEGNKYTDSERTARAKIWITRAIGQLIFYESEILKNENKKCDIALGLPFHEDYDRYIKLIKQRLEKMECNCYFIYPNGEIKTIF